MDLSKLKVDTKAYEDMGMTILSIEDIEGMRSNRIAMNWPEDYSWGEPGGVSLEEAREAMRRML